jgi:hypothetical protein
MSENLNVMPSKSSIFLISRFSDADIADEVMSDSKVVKISDGSSNCCFKAIVFKCAIHDVIAMKSSLNDITNALKTLAERMHNGRACREGGKVECKERG